MPPLNAAGGQAGGGGRDDDAFLAEFLRRVMDDRTEGKDLGLETYLGLFPGKEALVRRAWDEIHGPTAGSGGTTFQDGIPTPADPESGTEGATPTIVAGRYEIVRRLGVGGQGDVYLATDLQLKRRVALKLLRALHLLPGDELRRFRREAEVASRIDHPGVCAIYDNGLADGIPYIAMRHVEGRTLAEEIRGDGGDATAAEGAPAGGAGRRPGRAAAHLRAARIVEDAARALQAAHAAGVLHRDIKPANIMITPDERPVILDFGIARSTESDSTLRTRSGEVFGTPAYMAPELIETPPAVADRQTDVWSLGVTLYEALTGRRPFAAPTREGLYRAILKDAPEDPGVRAPSIPKDLRVVALTAIERARDRRYQSAEALAEDLRRVRCREPILARPAGPLLRAGRWIARDPMRAGLCALVLAVVATLGFGAARWPTIRGEVELARRQRDLELREADLERGFDAVAAHDGEAAVRSFDSALARAPGDVEASAGRVLALARTRRADEALAWLDGHTELEAAHPALTWARQSALRQAGRTTEAIALVRKLGRPEDPVSLYLSAFDHIGWAEVGDQAAAREGLELMRECVLRSRTNRALHVYHLAWAAMIAGDEAECRRAAAVIESRWPDSARALYWAALALQNWDSERALASCRRSLEIEPDSLSSEALLATILQKRGEVDRAIAIVERLLESSPDHARLLARIGMMRHEQGENDLAEEALKRAVALQPNLAVARNALGVLQIRRLANAEAAANFRAAVDTVPGLTSAWNNLAIVLWRLEDHEGAREAAARAHALNPALAEPRLLLGICLERAGDLEGAIREFRAALAARKDYDQAQAHLASSLAGLHRYRESRDAILAARESAERLGRPLNITASAIREVEEWAAIEERLEAFLAAKREPADAAEFAALAGLASRKAMPEVAARLYERGFEAHPSMIPDAIVAAAECASRAASGGPPATDDSGRAAVAAHWRLRAIEWLERALEVLSERVAARRITRSRAGDIVEHWTTHADFASIRDDGSNLASWPPDLAARATALWTRVRAAAAEWAP